MRFKDRREAGEKLAAALERYRYTDAVVYALPRGGVVVGAEISTRLNLPLDIVIVRKIGHPFHPEYAVGAISEHGESLFNESEVCEFEPEWLKHQVDDQLFEAQRRRRLYGVRELPAKGKIAILVDDGIATGFTTEVAIREIKSQNPSSVVLAVPVAPLQTVERLRSLVDDLVVLHSPRFYQGAVGAYYEEFDQVTDSEVTRILQQLDPLSLTMHSTK